MLAAPAIVHAGNLMPVKMMIDDGVVSWPWVQVEAGFYADRDLIMTDEMLTRLYKQWNKAISDEVYGLGGAGSRRAFT